MEQTANRKRKKFISLPLLKQSIKANWTFWLVITIGISLIMIIINLVIGGKSVVRSIDMNIVNQYIRDEGMDWLKILGLLNVMGFSLNNIQMMTTMDMTKVINELIYNVAALLLPVVYTAVIGNKLVASQVDNGSMAYVLSTPTNRKTVMRTQILFIVISIFCMYIVVASSSIFSEWLAYRSRAQLLRTGLLHVGLFVAVISMAAICFLGSCIFNRAKNALAFGGGLVVFFFICNILALFGTDTFVSLNVGVSSMKFFSYITILTLFDTESIDSFSKAVIGMDGGVWTFNWVYELLAMLAISVACFVAGGIVFQKKDLPL